ATGREPAKRSMSTSRILRCHLQGRCSGQSITQAAAALKSKLLTMLRSSGTGMSSPDLLPLFPHAKPSSPCIARWPHCRREVPHTGRSDDRHTGGITGYASVEEAGAYTAFARQFEARVRDWNALRLDCRTSARCWPPTRLRRSRGVFTRIEALE